MNINKKVINNNSSPKTTELVHSNISPKTTLQLNTNSYKSKTTTENTSPDMIPQKSTNLDGSILKASSGQNNGQFRILLFLLILLFSGITMLLVKTNSVNRSEIQEGIAEDIIRFHVIANSDSKEDQSLKLVVKDNLVTSLSPFLQDTEDVTEARTILSEKLDYIKELAEETIRQQGYNYSVTVTLMNCYFPLKIYGEYNFPPGIYEALRVQIGEAKGKNWWCVMYPPLCFVDETYTVMDDSSRNKLKHVLTEEEYNSLVSQKVPVKIKFKLWESFKDLF